MLQRIKHWLVIAMVVTLVGTLESCRDDCPHSREPVVRLVIMDTLDNNISYLFDRVYGEGIGEDVRKFDTAMYLPLSVLTPDSRFILMRGTQADTLLFSYSIARYFHSRRCGYVSDLGRIQASSSTLNIRNFLLDRIDEDNTYYGTLVIQ